MVGVISRMNCSRVSLVCSSSFSCIKEEMRISALLAGCPRTAHVGLEFRDLLVLLQSPANNLVSALASSKSKLAGVLKTLSEKEN